MGGEFAAMPFPAMVKMHWGHALAIILRDNHGAELPGDGLVAARQLNNNGGTDPAQTAGRFTYRE
ncbi:MAG: hypothetical protein JWR07_2346 [Nevskia sp.]|nr:hypothetical protein [Nevskia sp.]